MQTKRDNFSNGTAGWGIGTTATQLSTAQAFGYVIAGRSYHKAVTASQAISPMPGTTALAVPINSTQCLFISADVSGNLFYEQARQVATATGIQQGLLPSSTNATYAAGAYEWPGETPGYAMVGAVKIATNGSGTFTPGTTAFNASGVTATYYNVAEDYGVAIPT